MEDDFLVVGLDLTSGQEVHVAEQDREVWRRLGYKGEQTLVCLLCYFGIEAPRGTRVPLVTRGRVDGLVRMHFAHPPGQAPNGGHHPETIWHANSKSLLARWARAQPGVAEARLEQWSGDRKRRADVMVRLAGGQLVALEAQQAVLTGDAWRARHEDYRSAGIHDVWFWRRRGGVPRGVLDAGLPLWYIAPSEASVSCVLGKPHERGEGWWQEDLGMFALHHPPCPLDQLEVRSLPLDALGLTAAGAVLPDRVREELSSGQQQARRVLGEQRHAAREDDLRRQEEQREIEAIRQRRWERQRQARQARRAAAASRAGTVPTPRPSRTGFRCMTCHLPLDPKLAAGGRHAGGC